MATRKVRLQPRDAVTRLVRHVKDHLSQVFDEAGDGVPTFVRLAGKPDIVIMRSPAVEVPVRIGFAADDPHITYYRELFLGDGLGEFAEYV